jgi:competence protein ComEA
VSRSDRILVAAVGGALILVAAAGFVLLAPAEGQAPELDRSAQLLLGSPAATRLATADAAATIVVDVEGAVTEPGIRELPAGSRIADAIDAAGGFATDADLSAASSINLAQPLVDGQQVRVPRIGEGAPVAGEPDDGAGSSTEPGLINVNTATPEELESLPGIGAVTVQKIVAARQERPFTSLQDMVDRGVIHRGQLEDIAELATAG